MGENKSWSTIGNEIRCAVEDALKTGDFRDLGDVVSGTVKDVSEKVGQAVSDGVNGTCNYTEKWADKTRQRKQEQEERERQERLKAESERTLQAPFVKLGRISGILYQVFGAVGTGIMAVLAAVFLGLGIGLGGGWFIPFFIFILFLILFIIMINVGCTKRLRLRRAEKYVALAGNNHYVNVDYLAAHIGKTKKYVIKDIRKMLDSGMFPEGHLDSRESCLMLDDRIYQEYLRLEKEKRLQEKEQREQRKTAQEKGQTAEPAVQKQGSELEQMVAQGQECIKRLREMNDNIPGEEISAKLFRLENVLKEIFDGLQDHPEQLPQMKKFMNYYLPTTLKLVAAYEEFDDISAQGEEILDAKAEIEKTLDSINNAFEELLRRMFRETAFDVTTDAQVLQTMLEKEGLTGEKVFAVRRDT